MLTSDEIQFNKQLFLDILRRVSRKRPTVEDLIIKLESSDFFTAPASTTYHMNYAGGLCQHSLNVYNTLVKLVKQFYESEITDANGTVYISDRTTHSIDSDSIIIVALLHDVCKMDFYESYMKNEKVYRATGTKRDEQGSYDWVSTPRFKVRDADKRFLYATHGVNSEYIIHEYIPLTLEESVAIVNHMGTSSEMNLIDQSSIFSKYPLAALLHSADYLSTFILETEDA